jgi:DNA-binding MarR family transcriptional regulator
MHSPTVSDVCYCQAGRRGARSMSRIYDRHLAPAGISISQFGILTQLEHEPNQSIVALAERMVMERTTLVRALKPLREAGWVASAPTGAGRTLALALSKQGREKVVEAMPLWRAAQQEFEQAFGAERGAKLRTELWAVSRI